MNKALLLMVVLAACLFSPSSVLAQGETIETRVGELSFTHDFANGYPSKETVKLLLDEMDFQRACQA